MGNVDLRKKAVREERMRAAGVVAKTSFKEAVLKPKKIRLVLGDVVARGQNLSVFKPKKLDSLYDRKNLCLKVFKVEKGVWGHPRGVGQSPILESTIIQNLMALRGLAPRVYDLVEVNGKTAQVTDYLKGKMEVVPISDDRFHLDGSEVRFKENFIGGKFVDFQGTVFRDFGGYRKQLIDRAVKGTQDYGSSGAAYQSSRYFGGVRDTDKRLKRFAFPSFKGERVLDVGCNYGMFCREAVRLGAKRVVGIDWPKIIDIAQELAIIDGYFNIDFYGVNIKSLTQKGLEELTGIKRFDIHLFLSMEKWVGWPAWVKNCATLYFEGHGAERHFEVYQYKK